MSGEKIEEETYSLIFKSLKHPIRRKILRVLADRALAFSEILGVLSIDSGHLSYHIENLGDLVKHSANGKYELSGIGVAAVNLMSGVEERPQLLTPTKMMWKRIRNGVIGAVLVILIASVALNVYYSQFYSASLQANLEKNREASGHLAALFYVNVIQATEISYLSGVYAHYHGVSEPNEDNIEAVINGFFYQMESAQDFLYCLRFLNPELRTLFFLDGFIEYTFIWWEYRGEPTVRNILDSLLPWRLGDPLNYSVVLTAFDEFVQTSFEKIRELAGEVMGSFYFLDHYNATRLDNTVNIVEELQVILGQWIEKYS